MLVTQTRLETEKLWPRISENASKSLYQLRTSKLMYSHRPRWQKCTDNTLIAFDPD